MTKESIKVIRKEYQTSRDVIAEAGDLSFVNEHTIKEVDIKSKIES